MLFYETKGKFGEEDFEVTAKNLFLLDIGSQSYTEYDPADPELIKFLGANPEALRLKKGHIHSHNNMPVFFSGTDDSELVDNSGFHNFYVSLIVNNKNEMCAKIAFKAKTETETNITLSFLDETGKEKKKKLSNKKEEEAIYVYKCNVIKPGEVVEDSFQNRFQELQEVKIKKMATMAELKAKATRESFNFRDDWRQSALFEDIGATTRISKVEEKKSVLDMGDSKVDQRTYSMLSKLLALDPLYEGTLGGVLQKVDGDFYPFVENEVPMDQNSASTYYDAIMARAIDFYIDAFPEDTIKLEKFNGTMDKCISILETYEDHFPELITNLVESLSLEIK